MDKNGNSISEKDQIARNTLPEELWGEYERLVGDYKFAATLRYNRPFVSYIVLADLIKAGWRRSAEAIEE